MARWSTNDLDQLTARLHGRRSRLADGARLESLTRLGDVAELLRRHPATAVGGTSVAYQQALVLDGVYEALDCAAHLTGPGAELLRWLARAQQVEQLKLLWRGMLHHLPWGDLAPLVLPLPAPLTLASAALAAAGSPREFARQVPEPHLRAALETMLTTTAEDLGFAGEAALDQAYLTHLLVAACACAAADDGGAIVTLAQQEVDCFLLQVVLRGHFQEQLAPATLLHWFVPGARISREVFAAMLADTDWRTAANRVAGVVCGGPLPAGSTPASVDLLAWSHYARLATRAFRRDPVGLGAVVGYCALRRVEVASLITLTAGLQQGVAGDVLRGRLVAAPSREVAHV